MASFTSAQGFFISNSKKKKIKLIQNPMFSEPFVSRAKALRANRSEKGNGDEYMS